MLNCIIFIAYIVYKITKQNINEAVITSIGHLSSKYGIMSQKQNHQSVLLSDSKYLNSFQVERRTNLKARVDKRIFSQTKEKRLNLFSSQTKRPARSS